MHTWADLTKSHFYIMTLNIHTALSINEYTPFEKYHFKQYLNKHKNNKTNNNNNNYNYWSILSMKKLQQ